MKNVLRIFFLIMLVLIGLNAGLGKILGLNPTWNPTESFRIALGIDISLWFWWGVLNIVAAFLLLPLRSRFLGLGLYVLAFAPIAILFVQNNIRLGSVPAVFQQVVVFALVLLVFAFERRARPKPIGKLSERTILITGGSSGIGLALAKQLVSQGNTVIITGRKGAKLAEVAKEIPGLLVRAADVGEPASVHNLFADLRTSHLAPNMLINNAGLYGTWGAIVTPHELPTLSAMVRTNIAGPVLMFQAFAQQAATERLNIVVNISSEVALLPAPPVALYAATKAALHSFTQSLRVLARGKNFHIVEVLPPVVNTPMTSHQPNARTAITPQAFAQRVITDIESGKTVLSYGSNAMLLEVFARFSPKLGINLVDTFARKQIGLPAR